MEMQKAKKKKKLPDLVRQISKIMSPNFKIINSWSHMKHRNVIK